MMHPKHHTDAIVLAARDVGEASRMLCLFTRELGMVHAHAQGVRLLRSKLRHHLQPLTRAHVSLVRGREVWRVVGAEQSRAITAPAFPKIALLLRRLVHGEEADPSLFALVLSDQEETLWVAGILERLGYLDRRALVLSGAPLVSAINLALRETQL